MAEATGCLCCGGQAAASLCNNDQQMVDTKAECHESSCHEQESNRSFCHGLSVVRVFATSEALNQAIVWPIWLVMLCGVIAVLQAPGLQCVSLDHLPFQQSGLTTTGVDVASLVSLAGTITSRKRT